MGVLNQGWIRDIEEVLFHQNNSFINYSKNDDEFINGEYVNIPQAGSAPSVEKNRSSLPGTIAQRTDTVRQYPIDSYTTDPVNVRNFDELRTSYNKRQSVLGSHTKALVETVGTNCAQSWAISATAGKIIRTTGGNTNTRPTGATSTRKKVLFEDIIRCAEVMTMDDVPQEGRYMLMQSNMFYQLFEETEITSRDYVRDPALPDGVITKYMGFYIMHRPTVVVYDDTDAANDNGTLKAVGASYSGNDSFGCIAWHEDFVRKAMGGIIALEDKDRPEYYGGITSAEVAFGSIYSRTDGAGIVSLAQGL